MSGSTLISTLPPSPFSNAQNILPARFSSAVEHLSERLRLALGDERLVDDEGGHSDAPSK
jgi:hypothetical protein